VLAFLWKVSTCDILNNEHEIRRKTIILLRVQRDVINLFPHKVYHAERRCSIPHVS
jgi:hypothetical protein